MPFDAPVTTATLPRSFFDMIESFDLEVKLNVVIRLPFATGVAAFRKAATPLRNIDDYRPGDGNLTRIDVLTSPKQCSLPFWQSNLRERLPARACMYF